MRIKLSVPFTVKEIAEYIHGDVRAENAKISSVTTDSRDAAAGDLFIAVNDVACNFINDARAIGCYTLASTDSADIFVRDIDTALLDIARYYISRLKNLKHTIGITGSVGKSTTKEFTRLIMQQKYRTHANIMNFNNALGVFHTVLSAPQDTEILICELGMNHAGEISKLSKALTPDIAVITNIGSAHIGMLGSREKIANAKLEICDGMNGGAVFVDADEPLLKNAKGKRGVSRTDITADYYLKAKKGESCGSTFDFISDNLKIRDGFIGICGDHYLSCLMFALSVSSYAGLSEKEIKSGLELITSDVLRQRIIKIGKYNIYDDTYSSSPEAVIAALRALSLHSSRFSCVLGDMLELGEEAQIFHELIGREAARQGCVRLYAFGRYCNAVADGASQGGMSDSQIYTNGDILAPQITVDQIKSSYCEELLLIKGSHAIHTERIIALLSQDDSGK